jgi:hypothetical protein
MGAAALAGAAGSAAGQLVNMAAGNQDKFSWNGVAFGALSAGITQGLGGVNLTGGAMNSSANVIARAAVGNALTQGAAVVTGLQSHFDWHGVVGSAVATGVGQAVGGALGRANINPYVNRFVTGAASSTATALVRGGRVAFEQIATDAFGNALGQGLVDQSTSDARRATQAFQLSDEVYAGADTSSAPYTGTGVRPGSYLGVRITESAYKSWSQDIDEKIAASAVQSGPLDEVVSKGSIRDALYRPGVDDPSMVPVFKIYGAGAVHESITEEAARRAGVPYTALLRKGVEWNDAPSSEPDETNYPGLLKDMHTPGTLINDSHYGSKQFWHSMAPSDRDYTNGEVLDKIITQAKDWYQQARDQNDVFHIGKILHMVQDSYSESHVIRNSNGEIVSFESYSEQDSHEHGIADSIPKGGTWRDVPGAMNATTASAVILHFYYQGVGVDALEQYLRAGVYPLANGAAGAIAGGTAPQYQKLPPIQFGNPI